jgi:hypothetical protein
MSRTPQGEWEVECDIARLDPDGAFSLARFVMILSRLYIWDSGLSRVAVRHLLLERQPGRR